MKTLSRLRLRAICASPLPAAAAMGLLGLLMLCAVEARAQTAPDGDSPLTDVQFPNTPVPVILLEYERLTGRRVIRDANIQDKTLSIQTSGRMTYEEAAEFIEKSMLLNGYALVPTETEGQVKIIAFSADKHPSSEALPVFTLPSQLPDSEQVVTFVMPLTYLTPEAGAEIFANIINLHPYGRITPLPNANALVITENSSVIRRIVELRDHLDVSPIRTIDRTFELERADAEQVVEALIDVLDLDQGSPSSAPRGESARPGDEGRGGADPPDQIRGPGARPQAASPTPRVRAIPRANRVLVVATPVDMDYIAGIIEHLDAPVETASYMRLKLRYLAASDFLDIASNVILRGRTDSAVQESQGGGEQRARQNTLGGGTEGTGVSGELGRTDRSFGTSRSGATGQLGSAGADQAVGPRSLVIDKTLLIADNVQNMLIVSGPPENLRQIEELVVAMDVRPVQIQISAVIAQLNLSDDFEFGFDLLRSFEFPGDGSRGNAGGSFVSRTGQSRRLLDISTLTDVNNLLPAAQGLTFYGQVNPYLDGFVSALGATNRFKVLSRPTVYTVNNRQAVIETGQRVAVPRSTLSSLDTTGVGSNQIVTANIDFENVVLRIAVLPLINANGEITLQIQQKNDEIVGSQLIGGDEIPTIGTQTLGTTVMVDDGGTVLLGGLISEGDRKSESGLPLFANLPLVGRVFGSTGENVSRQELLIFLQPKVIRHHSDQLEIDHQLIDRTRVGSEATEFATNETNNLDHFESQDFESPAKRIHFFRNLFERSRPEPARGGGAPSEPRAGLRAVPVAP